jgi:transposase
MPRSRPEYPPEFRQKLIQLVEAGRSPEELAKEFEPSAQTIRNWVKRAQADGGKRRTVFRDSLSSREIALMLLPSTSR